MVSDDRSSWSEGRIAIFTEKAGQETTPELSKLSTAKKADIQKT